MRCQTETADGRNNTACRQRKRIFESRPHQYDECDEGSGKGHRKAPLVEVAQRTAHKGTQCCRACPWQPEAKSRADMKGVAETFVFRNARGFSFRDFLHAHGPHFVAHEKESKETFAGGKFFGVERQCHAHHNVAAVDKPSRKGNQKQRGSRCPKSDGGKFAAACVIEEGHGCRGRDAHALMASLSPQYEAQRKEAQPKRQGGFHAAKGILQGSSGHTVREKKRTFEKNKPSSDEMAQRDGQKSSERRIMQIQLQLSVVPFFFPDDPFPSRRLALR